MKHETKMSPRDIVTVAIVTCTGTDNLVVGGFLSLS